MQDIFDTILGQLSPYRARLVAVSKTKPRVAQGINLNNQAICDEVVLPDSIVPEEHHPSEPSQRVNKMMESQVL